ncbi:MAG: hypothetical protein ACI4PE_05100 [Bacilli bacterium]
MKSKEESLKDLKEKIAISKLLEEEKMKEKVNVGNVIKPMVAASVMIVSLSGMVFAKDISTRNL